MDFGKKLKMSLYNTGLKFSYLDSFSPVPLGSFWAITFSKEKGKKLIITKLIRNKVNNKFQSKNRIKKPMIQRKMIDC